MATIKQEPGVPKSTVAKAQKGTQPQKSTLPPFLEKLQRITETIPAHIAAWAEDGKTYRIHKAMEFERVLKGHFKGSLQTFVRQLHFYGFRKLDSRSDAWSFSHKYFVQNNPSLLQEIRRKTRSDPTADCPASQLEVLTLRTQVAFLQDVVENLRTQLDSVINVLDEAGVAEVERRAHDGKALRIKSGTKRQRSDINGAFSKTCEVIEPVLTEEEKDAFDPEFLDDIDFDSASLGGLSNSDLGAMDLQGATDDEFELDLQPAPLVDDANLSSDVIQSISKATHLDQDSVSRVVNYFKKLSTKDTGLHTIHAPALACGKSDPLSESMSDLSHLSFQQLSDSVLSYKKHDLLPALQKVR